MSPLILKLIKIAFFFIAGYITAKISVSYFRKKNPNAAMSDPEVIALAVFCGALVSGLLSFIIKRILF
jgi:ABC-type branched-subunit amino acid transport system permease subunit